MAELSTQAHLAGFWGTRAIALQMMDSLPDIALFSMSDTSRRDLLATLSKLAGLESEANSPCVDPDLRHAITRVLFTTPYPEDIQRRDRLVTQDFYEQWQILRRTPMMQTATQQAYLGDCRLMVHQIALMAAKTMGLVPSMLRLYVRETAFSAANSGIQTQDFDGFACVQTKIGADNTVSVNIEINEEHDFWQNFRRDSDDHADVLASAVFHEISHVEQIVAAYDGSDHPEFYELMQNQTQQLIDLMGHFSIYRGTLSERQAYYRSNMFLDINKPLADLMVNRNSELAYCTRDLNANTFTRKQMQIAANHLIATMTSRKPESP